MYLEEFKASEFLLILVVAKVKVFTDLCCVEEVIANVFNYSARYLISFLHICYRICKFFTFDLGAGGTFVVL